MKESPADKPSSFTSSTSGLSFAETNRQLVAPETWVDDHGDYLFRFAWKRLQNREIAEDMVQETYLEALKGFKTFRGDASERTWLISILRHKIVDYFRKSSREDLVEDERSLDGSEDSFDENGKWAIKPLNWKYDPKSLLEKKEFWQILKRCLGELPQRMAHTFTLRELEELGSAEISQIVGISLNNLSVVLYRARMKLRRCLEINWFEQKAG
ncbi:MAG: sigma-70 family RNA polymerase sigma factor [Desulfomonile tiedjei]|uniref:Sigma-70 family RNA polymerase sigma factor n=1 Tax=Desulfomonile tiedjei TaxID=2358 RepID=A0A9D6UYR9_9BACT|nr:sigma-70 family RNA polymerase sigma factor [Desulfomonile tiedjei]